MTTKEKRRISELEKKIDNLAAYLAIASNDIKAYAETKLRYEERQLEYFELTGQNYKRSSR